LKPVGVTGLHRAQGHGSLYVVDRRERNVASVEQGCQACAEALSAPPMKLVFSTPEAHERRVSLELR